MGNIFNTVPGSVPKRNLFNLSHEVKTTFEMGQLVPFFCEPVIPGDRFKVATSQLIRFAPMLAPVMSNIDAYVHFFFVPNRLIWKNWEDFITQSHNGKSLKPEELPEYPTIKVSSQATNNGTFRDTWLGKGTLYDYLGFQTYPKGSPSGHSMDIDALPFRAYQKVFFDYYRDENLSNFDEFTIDGGSVRLDPTEYASGNSAKYPGAVHMTLRRRAWKKDYFTSALPFAQKGDDVLIPGQPTGNIGAIAEFAEGRFSLSNASSGASNSTVTATSTKSNLGTGVEATLYANNGVVHPVINIEQLAAALKVNTLGNPDESTIRDLRRAYAAQRYLERKALGGSRYIEQNLAFFGVKSSDARLQRSEFLGGMKQPIVISQVLQTSQTTTGETGSPLGQPAGNAVSAGSQYIFDRFFEEYGFVIGIISVIPKADYLQGMPKKYLKRDPFDFYWPQFAKIGEQPIQRQELYWDPRDLSDAKNEETFGYTPRYAEYRFINNHVHGDFKESLKFWTLARDFNSLQSLNEDFISCNPSNRIFAVQESDFNHLWVQIGINCRALRPITKYGESY